MAISSLTQCVCDLCGNKEVADKLPASWMKVNLENPQLDRSFFEKAICPVCIRKIKLELNHRRDFSEG